MIKTKTVLRVLDILVLSFIGVLIFYVLNMGEFWFGGGIVYKDVYPLTTIASLILGLSLYGITKTKSKTLTFTVYLFLFQLPLMATIGDFNSSLLWIFAITIPGIILLGSFLNHKRTGRWLTDTAGLVETEYL